MPANTLKRFSQMLIEARTKDRGGPLWVAEHEPIRIPSNSGGGGCCPLSYCASVLHGVHANEHARALLGKTLDFTPREVDALMEAADDCRPDDRRFIWARWVILNVLLGDYRQANLKEQ